MGKQPYIPLYVGDYLKDTRILPLAVRGAWVDLICYMWDSRVRGEISGTLEDFSRLLSCEKSEAKFALNLLEQKNVADFFFLENDVIKIVSRKMKREADISKKRAKAGKTGGKRTQSSKNFAKAKVEAKFKQNTDIDIDIDNDIEIINKKESEIIFPFTSDRFLKTWKNWKLFRSQIKKPYRSELSEQMALKKLSQHDEATAIAMIEQSIANSWQGIFDVTEKSNGKLSAREKHIDSLRKDFAERASKID